MADGKIDIKLDIDDKDAISSANKSVDGLGSSIGSKITSGCKIAGAALFSLGVAGTAAFGKLALDSFKAAGELEQNIGGSEAVFGEFADVIQQRGAEAFNQLGLSQSEYLATANKMGSLFKGSGVESAAALDLTSASMQRAADVASVMGISTEAAMESIAGAAKGNFTMMDNLGVAITDTSLQAYAQSDATKAQLDSLKEQGVISAESYDLMASALGKTTQEMSSAEKNALAMGMFLDKSSFAAGNYAKENMTLAGSISTMKAAFENFLSGAGTPEQLAEAFTNFANVAIEMASTLLPNLISSLSTLASNIIPQLSGMIGELAPIIVEGILSLITAVGEVLPQLADTLIPAVAQMATGLISALPMLIEVGMQIVVSLINGITEALPELIPAIVELIPNLIEALLSNIPQLIEGFIQLFTAFAKALPTIIETIVGLLPTLISSLVTTLVTLIPILIEGFIQLFMAFIQALPQIITAIVGALPQIITGIIEALIIAIPQLIQGFIQLFMAFIQALPTIIVTIVGAIPEIISSIIDALAPLAGDLFNSAVTAFNDFISGIGSMLGEIGAKAEEVVTNVFDELSKLPDKVIGIGGDVVKGLVEGITDMVDWAVGKVKEFGDSILGGLKDFFGIESPSKLMRFEVGQDVGRGVVVGFEDIDPMAQIDKSINAGMRKLETNINTKAALAYEAPADSTGTRMMSMLDRMGKGIDTLSKAKQNIYLSGRLVGLGTFDTIDERYGSIQAAQAGGF